jgi:hypothetical protein
VTKVNADGSALVYSTYLGGTENDWGWAIAVDTSGNADVTGSTLSTDFPTVNPIQPSKKGNEDAFVTKIIADGGALAYSTYLGGPGDDKTNRIAVDAAGSVYVIWEYSNFLRTALAFQPSMKGKPDALITKIASQTFVIASPGNIVLGKMVIGNTSAPKKLTFTNNGSDSVTIKKVYVAGKDVGDFGQTNNCPAMLSAGGFCSVWVTFTPAGKNKRQAVLGISNSDPASPQAIPLSGAGTVVVLSATRLTFGKQIVNTIASKNVAITNVGNTRLNFTGISITGTSAADYSQTNTCGASISAGTTCTITVIFRPMATGMRTAAVSIGHDGGGSPHKVNLTGVGI